MGLCALYLVGQCKVTANNKSTQCARKITLAHLALARHHPDVLVRHPARSEQVAAAGNDVGE